MIMASSSHTRDITTVMSAIDSSAFTDSRHVCTHLLFESSWRCCEWLKHFREKREAKFCERERAGLSVRSGQLLNLIKLFLYLVARHDSFHPSLTLFPPTISLNKKKNGEREREKNTIWMSNFPFWATVGWRWARKLTFLSSPLSTMPTTRKRERDCDSMKMLMRFMKITRTILSHLQKKQKYQQVRGVTVKNHMWWFQVSLEISKKNRVCLSWLKKQQQHLNSFSPSSVKIGTQCRNFSGSLMCDIQQEKKIIYKNV